MLTIDLSGQTAVVTGGAQGIGLAAAAALKGAGAQVALWDMDGQLACDAAAELGSGAIGVAVDVTDETAIAAALSATTDTLGHVSILVNSAGIAGPNATVADYDSATWRQVIDINLNGTFYVNKAVVPVMIERGYGRICNIASIAGKEGNPNASAYSASKAAVIALTKSLGKELAGHDIAVNCVTPAAAKTRIFDQMSQEHIDYMLSKIPRNRFLQIEEAANMIAWIVSPQNSFTTSAVFDLSGGRATY
jgi:3-oxoacyl-[acyl-carrier protein] reductase